MKRLVVSIILFGATACTPEPSKEEAGVALVVLDDAAALRPLLEALERAVDGGTDAAPPAATANPHTAPKGAGTPPLLKRKIIVEELRCVRVDRGTHRCDAVWRRERDKVSTRGRYLFTKKSGAWQATDDPPTRALPSGQPVVP